MATYFKSNFKKYRELFGYTQARLAEKTEKGKKPGPVKQYIFYPDKWGQYTFGLPSEMHGIIPKVDLKAGDT